jgi:hippurate hydrolase
MEELSQAMLADLVALRRDLHAHPELGFAEHRTADIVAERLAALGIEVHRGLAGTGVVGTLRAGPGTRAIGLRADMDGLPLAEMGNVAHRSTAAGRMHACGHDGHTAMLLGAAAVLAGTRRFDGVVHLIFQPAEEGGGGGRVMVEQGLLERFPVEMVFGLHNWPAMPAGTIAVRPGPVMAGTGTFEVIVTGRGGHAAMPHLAADPVVAGSAIVQGLQSLVSRTLDPLRAGVVSVTRFHAGSADNILPETATLVGTIRFLDPLVEDLLHDGLRRVCAGVAAAHGVCAEVHYDGGYPPTVNDAAAAVVCRDAAAAAVGRDRVVTDADPSMGGEDFAYLVRAVPGCYAWLGAAREGDNPGLHSPRYDFNDDILAAGVRYWTALIERVLPLTGG